MNTNNRERLLNAATEMFLDHGYNASVDQIVGRAGVARQTFYNHFENKEHLFAEAMRNCIADLLVPLSGEQRDLRQTLETFALAYRQRILSPQGIAGYRIMTGQAHRFPKLMADAFRQGLGQMVESLADVLKQAMHAGNLRRDDTEFAAEMLLAMLAGLDRTRLLFGVMNPQQAEVLRVQSIVDGFLRIYVEPTTTTV